MFFVDTLHHHQLGTFINREGSLPIAKPPVGVEEGSSLDDDPVGPYLAKWASPFPLARRQTNAVVKVFEADTNSHGMREAWRAVVDAYTTSLLPPNAMCELVLN